MNIGNLLETPTGTVYPDCHDRWIVLDYGLASEQVYHCGASSKDAGRKVCAINKVENVALVHPVMVGLLVVEDNLGIANPQ